MNYTIDERRHLGYTISSAGDRGFMLTRHGRLVGFGNDNETIDMLIERDQQAIQSLFAERDRHSLAFQNLCRILTDHIATLESAGFGGEAEIDGAAAIGAVIDHFQELRDALAAMQP